MPERDRSRRSSASRKRRCVWWECKLSQFGPIVTRLKEAGARLITLSVYPGQDGEMGLSYFFELDGSFCIVKTQSSQMTVPSLYTLFVSADYLEREANALFDLKFTGHPNLPGASSEAAASEGVGSQ